MRTILHLWTTPPDPLAQALVNNQRIELVGTDTKVEVIDLSVSEAPDYGSILDRIFAAESVTTW